ncbi:hypothetical protein [Streptomyces sp. SID13726]|uniref:hypothetical protein n=1 Tax=Streptomyces sp. SID13726 TaxID=2706058 RepID=UPI001943864B|nr:hypothetical protein [Streptomyces sp. SID13726]
MTHQLWRAILDASTRRSCPAKVETGALFVGSPGTVARTIDLLGREVAPRVRELLTKEPAHV